jgi:murein hydrolase activator
MSLPFAILALSTSAAAASPLLPLTDAGWPVRDAHRRAIWAALAAPDNDQDSLAVRARLSARGQRYHLPVLGKPLVAGADEPPGLLLATRPGALVIAPRRSRVAYAGPFRRYGDVLILEHGHGWTTVLTGLDRLDVAQGASLQDGERVGRAGAQVRVRLLHHGQVADVARVGGLQPSLVISPQAALR